MYSAIITGVSGYVPERVLSNHDLEKMMDTNDEWITSRTGIKERRIMPEGEAVTSIGTRAVTRLLEKTGANPASVDLVVCATCTADYLLPGSANAICKGAGLSKAFGFDLNAACSGFVFALHTAAQFIKAGTYKKVIVIGAEKFSALLNYRDRATSIIFGDGGGAVLLEASEDPEYGIKDAVLKGDGDGVEFLQVPSGGSLSPTTMETIPRGEQYVTQDGKVIFKKAVTGMSDTVSEVMQRNSLSAKDVDWLIPHQANLRIIKSIANILDFPMQKVMVNIEKYGNTSAGTIPLCLNDFEHKFKKGDNVMLTAFGGGFTWGTLYLKWAY